MYIINSCWIDNNSQACTCMNLCGGSWCCEVQFITSVLNVVSCLPLLATWPCKSSACVWSQNRPNTYFNNQSVLFSSCQSEDWFAALYVHLWCVCTDFVTCIWDLQSNAGSKWLIREVLLGKSSACWLSCKEEWLSKNQIACSGNQTEAASVAVQHTNHYTTPYYRYNKVNRIYYNR